MGQGAFDFLSGCTIERDHDQWDRASYNLAKESFSDVWFSSRDTVFSHERDNLGDAREIVSNSPFSIRTSVVAMDWIPYGVQSFFCSSDSASLPVFFKRPKPFIGMLPFLLDSQWTSLVCHGEQLLGFLFFLWDVFLRECSHRCLNTRFCAFDVRRPMVFIIMVFRKAIK
jgi:hypothetical protein